MFGLGNFASLTGYYEVYLMDDEGRERKRKDEISKNVRIEKKKFKALQAGFFSIS